MFGTAFDAGGIPHATVWTAPTGTAWSGAPLVPGEGPSQVDAATDYRGVTVVVGAEGDGANQQASAWISRDGGPYRAVPVPITDGASVMSLVTAGELGYFATGTVDGHLAVWESTDGQQWTEVSSAEQVITSTPGATVTALLDVGQNVYAAGWVQPGAVPQAALWASGDGLSWHLVDTALTSFTGTYGRVIYSLAPLGSGLVAVGAIDGGAGWEPASWISPNGLSWSLPSTDFPAGATTPSGGVDLGPSGGAAALSVADVPSLDSLGPVVASGGGPYGQAAWRSADGLHWASLAMPAAEAGSGTWRAGLVGATSNQTVIADRRDGEPYVMVDSSGSWSQPSSQPAMFGPIRPVAQPVSLQEDTGRLLLAVDLVTRPQTIGPATVTLEYLQSADGNRWTRIGSGNGPKSVPAVGALTAHTAGGWVAVASSRTAAPAAWTSPGGAVWTRHGSLPAPFQSIAAGGASTAAPTLPPGSEPGGFGAADLCAVPNLQNPEVAVGSGTFVAPGAPTATTGAAAWYRKANGTWALAAVPQALPAGSSQAMTGCAVVTDVVGARQLYAYGTAASSSGSPQPALWRSTDGTSWTRVGVGTFVPDSPNPIISLASSGSRIVAVASPDPGAEPFDAGRLGAPGPAAVLGRPGFERSPSLESGTAGVWVSADGGSTWAALDTASAPWLGAARSEPLATAFTAAGTAVVVGVVDGQLAVWTASAA
jgi:hypothetical protein